MKPAQDPLERIFNSARKAQKSDERTEAPFMFSANVLRVLQNQGHCQASSTDEDAWERLSLAAIPLGAFVALVSLLLAAPQAPLEDVFNAPENVARSVINETIEP
jgi:hypothetical protein